MRGLLFKVIGVGALVGVGLLSLALQAYAVDPPDTTPSVSDIAANVYLLEEDDVLIYGLYNLPYASVPTDSADQAYVFRLMDGDDQLGVVAPFVYFDNGYNEGVFAFYFSASDNLTIETVYTIRLSQSPAYFDDPQSYDSSMPMTAWTDKTDQDDNQAELTLHILNLATTLATEHDATLTESSVGGTVLSDPAGETYFRGAIYGIQAMAPDLFLVQSLTWDTSDREWATTEYDSYTSRFTGTFIGEAVDETETAFGIDGQTLMTLLFLLPIVIGACLLSQWKWRKLEPGYMVGSLALILTALMGWVELALFATIFQMFVLYIGYLFFYARASDSLGGKFFSFLAFTWLLSVAICLIVEGSWIGGSENTIINDLSAFTTLKIGGLIPIPAPNLFFFRGLFRILLWDYSFYTGDFAFLRYLWLVVFSGSAVYLLGKDFVPVFANFLRIR